MQAKFRKVLLLIKIPAGWGVFVGFTMLQGNFSDQSWNFGRCPILDTGRGAVEIRPGFTAIGTANRCRLSVF